MPPAQPKQPTTKSHSAEVFWVFLKLGLTSFGGPVAHLGYFHRECIQRRQWASEAHYANLLALCQFLPGPASSQLGFALGLTRAGWPGAWAAFLGFTLPSALLMFGLSLMAQSFALPAGLLDGLKILAVAVVAHALLAMSRALCPDAPRAAIALCAVAILALWSNPFAMALVIVLGGLLGLLLRPNSTPATESLPKLPIGRGLSLLALASFALLLTLTPILAPLSPGFALFDGFSRAGALVFGGGHVVLPLLEAELVQSGQVSAGDFLAGYGAAQAMPGPLFTFAAWLGALAPPAGLAGALIALSAIFLPGFLLLIAALPHWARLQHEPWARRAMAGANAAVVGVLALAFYDPVFTSAVDSKADFALALFCTTALVLFKAPSLLVVALAALGGMLLVAFT